MNRHDMVLAGLAAAGENATLSPVQVQKLFFIIDREIPEAVNGPHFSFTPYDYGPFDSSVYTVLNTLRANGLANEVQHQRYRQYALTNAGYQEGVAKLATVPEDAQQYIRDVAHWVRSLSFAQLVSAIYQHYPEMKANSVFSG